MLVQAMSACFSVSAAATCTLTGVTTAAGMAAAGVSAIKVSRPLLSLGSRFSLACLTGAEGSTAVLSGLSRRIVVLSVSTSFSASASASSLMRFVVGAEAGRLLALITRNVSDSSLRDRKTGRTWFFCDSFARRSRLPHALLHVMNEITRQRRRRRRTAHRLRVLGLACVGSVE